MGVHGGGVERKADVRKKEKIIMKVRFLDLQMNVEVKSCNNLKFLVNVVDTSVGDI